MSKTTKSNPSIDVVLSGALLLESIQAAMALGADTVMIQTNIQEPGVQAWMRSPNPTSPSAPLLAILSGEGAGASRTLHLGPSAFSAILDNEAVKCFFSKQVGVLYNKAEQLLEINDPATSKTLMVCPTDDSDISDATAQPFGESRSEKACHVQGNHMVYNETLPSGVRVNITGHIPIIDHAPLLREHLRNTGMFSLKPVTAEQVTGWLNTLRNEAKTEKQQEPPAVPLAVSAVIGKAPEEASPATKPRKPKAAPVAVPAAPTVPAEPEPMAPVSLDSLVLPDLVDITASLGELPLDPPSADVAKASAEAATQPTTHATTPEPPAADVDKGSAESPAQGPTTAPPVSEPPQSPETTAKRRKRATTEVQAKDPSECIAELVMQGYVLLRPLVPGDIDSMTIRCNAIRELQGELLSVMLAQAVHQDKCREAVLEEALTALQALRKHPAT
jgi:hypothetical protein